MRAFITAIVVVLLVIVGYSLVQQTRNTTHSPPATISPTVSETPISSISSNLAPDTRSFKDTTGLFTFTYPNEYTLDSQNDGTMVRIYKTGSTQQGQTEMYDGVLMVFEPLSLPTSSLSSWVDDRIKQETADGTSELVNPKKAFTINSYPGYSYSLRGLGSSTHYILQKNSSSSQALHITVAIHDPQSLGYQTKVDAILSTLQILK